MDSEIYYHDTDIDVVHKYNTIELKAWNNQLKYIDKEIDKLLKLYGQTILGKDVPKHVFDLFSKRKKANNELYAAVLKYSNNYREALECEDIQCDMAFLEEFERLRKSYQYHLTKYQKLKDNLYDNTL